MLRWDVKEEELKPGHMQKEKWSMLSDIIKYVQYNQYPIVLEVKGQEVRNDTKKDKKLQNGEREMKEISFDSYIESLKQDYLDILQSVKSDIMYAAQYEKNSDIGTTYLEIPKMRR